MMQSRANTAGLQMQGSLLLLVEKMALVAGLQDAQKPIIACYKESYHCQMEGARPLRGIREATIVCYKSREAVLVGLHDHRLSLVLGIV